MRTDTLKPCPFCGGTDLYIYIDGEEFLRDFEVYCAECGGQVSYFGTEADAIAAWNRRAEDA